MKKQLITLVLSIISLGVYSQSTIWQSYGSGLPINWGIRYISAVSADTVWAIGFHGTSYSSTNVFTKTGNGASFTTGTFLPDTNTCSASSICALDSNTAFISIYDKAGNGPNGQILKTTNGGYTITAWTNIASDSMFVGANNFPDFVYFWNTNTGIAVGDPNGHTVYDSLTQVFYGDTVPQFEIWQTINGASTWTRVSDTLIPSPYTNEYGQSNSYAVYGQKVWFGTSLGRVFISSDTGRWTARPTGLYGGVLGIAFRDTLNGIAWGYENSITQVHSVATTTNGGLQWTVLNSNSSIGTSDFCVIPGTYGYMSVGLNSEASFPSIYATYVSYNDGVSWDSLEANTLNIENISVVQMVDTIHGWAGTKTISNTTGMNKYIGHSVAGIIQIPNNNNKVTVYPNPSNGYFNFSLVNSAADTEISVCDMLGNEVYKTTIKGSAANQNLNIDLSNMQKGMYLLKMQSGNTNQIQKLIIQ
jgi:hypothetical protein